MNINRPEKLKHISSVELLKEVESRFKSQLITRKDLLQSAGIDWCLECWHGEGEIEDNGYCEDCNDSQVRIISSEVK